MDPLSEISNVLKRLEAHEDVSLRAWKETGDDAHKGKYRAYRISRKYVEGLLARLRKHARQ